MTSTQDGPNGAPVRATPAQIAQIKQRAAILSVMATLLLTGAKFIGAILSGSLALLADALQGLIDIGSTLFTWFAVRVSDKPADDEHHYGHGKVEALAALVETAILFTLAGAILWEAGNRLWQDVISQVSVTPLVIGIIGRGHLEYGHGTPYQWRDLGIEDIAVLLPTDRACHEAASLDGIADAIFRLDTPEPPSPRSERPKPA